MVTGASVAPVIGGLIQITGSNFGNNVSQIIVLAGTKIY